MMKKKILSLVVVMAMMLSFMPVIAQAETSGECGANLTWTLDDNGTLTISGEGTMKNWISYSYAPWYSSSSSIKNIIINNGVESIGSYAFYECSKLKSVTIGNSVESIGEGAFSGCRSLESVVIPDSVTSIGWNAFYSCSSLTDVYYGGSEAEWKAISIGSGNTPLTNATIHYNSTGIPSSLDCQTQILNYSEIDGKYMIKSTAKNNTDTAISCVMYSSVYSSDGTLKACGTVKENIDAGSDKEVDITVPCTIETGDTIKTFMWADNMTPFAKAGKLVIE